MLEDGKDEDARKGRIQAQGNMRSVEKEEEGWPDQLGKVDGKVLVPWM